jgi:hypothetical protein
MGGEGTYRDELAAAQARIETLERQVAESSEVGARARTIAALLRERAGVAAAIRPVHVWPRLWWMFVVLWVAGGVLAAEGDWVFGGLALLAPLLVGFVGQAIVRSNAAAAVRQIALIDARLAELQAPPAGEA